MRKRKIRVPAIILATIILLILTLFLIRAFSPRELDDVSPGMECSKKLLEKSDVFWVIPEFNNQIISENKTWCEKILNMNKTIGMHGVSHTFREFGINRNQEYLDRGMQIFEECFGYKPTMFKPPQINITTENKELIKNNNLILKGMLNQMLHKEYHCGEYGKKVNWINDLL